MKCKYCGEELKWYEGWFSKMHKWCKFAYDFSKFKKAVDLINLKESEDGSREN